MSFNGGLKGRMLFWILCVSLGSGLTLSLAVDSDNDGMSDLYETFFKLDAADGSDAAGNPDTDGLSNLQESGIWTDPHSADTDLDGWEDALDDDPLSRAVICWGSPDFTQGDDYRYTGPQWFLGASKGGRKLDHQRLGDRNR